MFGIGADAVQDYGNPLGSATGCGELNAVVRSSGRDRQAPSLQAAAPVFVGSHRLKPLVQLRALPDEMKQRLGFARISMA